MTQLKQLKTTQPWNGSEMVECAYYLSQLSNKHGNIDSLMYILQSTEVSTTILLTILRKFDSNLYMFDAKSISEVTNRKMSEWTSVLDSIFVPDKDRDVNNLINLMKLDSNNSSFVLKRINKVSEYIKDIKKVSRLTSAIISSGKYISKIDQDQLKEVSNKCLAEFHEDCIIAWTETIRAYPISEDIVAKNLREVIAVVNRGVELCKKFSLRDTQKLSVVLFVRSDSSRGMLQQVATGEGKSVIIASIAIIKALSGKNVDIITSSSSLASRDAKDHKKLYELFGVSVGHNQSELVEGRKAIYTNKDVVYGTLSAFQRDLLLDEFYNEDIGVASREKGWIIVDEVDSLLLDKGQNQLYLSHSLPGMDFLEHVYVYIWKLIHTGEMWGTVEDMSCVRISMIDAMYGIVTEQELQKLCNKENLWEKFIKHKFAGSDGRILIREDLESYSRTGKVHGKLEALSQFGLSESDEKELLGFLKNKMRQGILLPLPKHLKEYVDLHLSSLVKNAFVAKSMVQNDHYIIDSDRTESANTTAPNIVIMDKDTGEEQYHSQWSNGLHQFLQLKHGTRLSNEGLKAVYLSNVSFFSKYGSHLMGLSGTLGSTRERDLLKLIYRIEYATIPSFRPSRFTEEVVKVCQTEEEWRNAIVKSSERIYQEETRPVLVICESVRDVEKLEKQFRLQVHVYKHSYEPLSVGTDTTIKEACIILATNLAGRGTDIKIGKKINGKGGMHVCLTYLPPNLRVEEQAFGRAGRKGQKGTGQIICLDTDEDHNNDMLSVVKMKLARNFQEEEHIAKIQEQYESVVKVEEAFFEQFQSAYRAIDSRTKYLGKKLQKIVLNSCLDQWAFCLDRASQEREEDVKHAIINEFVLFLQNFQCSREKLFLHVPNGLIQGPSHCTELAKILIDKKEYEEALKILKDLVEKDESFSEIGHYYLGHCLTNKGDVSSNINDRNEFFQHLSQAKRLIRQRCHALTSYACVVSHISKSYTTKRGSFLFADDYEKQKQDMVEVLHVFLRTIDDLKGHPVYYTSVQLENSDLFKAFYVFNILCDKEILEPAKVATNIPKDVMNEINDKYNVYYKELNSVIERHKNKAVTAKAFRKILPSREEFWELLLVKDILSNEKTFVVLDKGLLKKELDGIPSDSLIVRQVIAQMLALRGCPDLISVKLPEPDRENNTEQTEVALSSMSAVCLHPEQIPDILSLKLTVIHLEKFQNCFGSLELWEFLFDRNILSVNKSANLRYSHQANIGRYDGLHESVFSEIEGISEIMAKEIYSDLKDCCYKSINRGEFQLKGYKQFQAEIEAVALKHVQYRQALDELAFSGKIILDSHPHKDLFEDLLRLNVITPAQVNHRMSSAEIKTRITETFGTKSSADTEPDDKEDIVSTSHPALVSFKQITDLCEERTSQVWKSLKEQNCIDDQFHVTCDEETLTELDLPVPVKLFLASVLTTKEVSDKLVDTLQQMQSSVLRVDKAFTHLNGLEVIPDARSKGETISMCKTNGFGDIICLSKNKLTWQSFGKMAAVACLGLGQIFLGALLLSLDWGIGTFPALPLILRGSRDIFIAIQCFISGNCTWASYWEHKKQSPAESFDIQSLCKRVAQFTKYGYNLSVRYMQKFGGFKFDDKDSKKTEIINTVKTSTKEILLTGVTHLTGGAVGIAADRLLSNFVTEISQQIIDNLKAKFLKADLQNLMNELCKIVGLEQGHKVLENISLDPSWRKSKNDIVKKVSECGDAIFLGFEKTLNTSSGSTNKVQHFSIVNSLSSAIKKTKDDVNLHDINQAVEDFTEKMAKKMKNFMTQKDGEEIELNEEQSLQMCEEFIRKWQEDLIQSVSFRISEDITKPIMRHGTQVMCRYSRNLFKSCHKKYETRQPVAKVEEEKEKLRDVCRNIYKRGIDERSLQKNKEINKEYMLAAVNVLVRTRKPELLAKLVKEEGLPMGVYCAQALANIHRRPIVIEVTDVSTSVMPTRFVPTQTTIFGDPIHLVFSPGANGSFDSFSFKSDSGDKLVFDCMLDALCHITGNSFTRSHVARVIQTDLSIRQQIESGITMDQIFQPLKSNTLQQ